LAFGYWFVYIRGDVATSPGDVPVVSAAADRPNHHLIPQAKDHPQFQAGTMGTTASAPVSDEKVADVASSFNEFGLDLFNTLGNVEDGNVLISPLSIATALSMVAAGTTADSKNAQQFDKTLRLPVSSDSTRDALRSALQRVSSVDPKVKLLLANSQWTRGPIKDSYKAQLSEVFAAEARDLPGSPDPINKWVKDNTGGLIEKLLDEVDPLAVAVLINAVYFKGEWASKFDKANTRELKFHLPSGPPTPCKMMFRKGKVAYKEIFLTEKARQAGLYDAQLVELPYGSGQDFGAVVILPRKGGESSVRDITTHAMRNPGTWDGWLNRLPQREVELYLPRFKLEYGVKDIVPALVSMGLEEAFLAGTPGRMSGFERMTDDPLVYLSNVFHKAVMEVNEEGTEAAAVTGAVMATRSMPAPPAYMLVDHPFLFAVRDLKSGLLLFIGDVQSPEF